MRLESSGGCPIQDRRSGQNFHNLSREDAAHRTNRSPSAAAPVFRNETNQRLIYMGKIIVTIISFNA